MTAYPPVTDDTLNFYLDIAESRASEPYDPRVTRATIWVDDETWKKHVKIGDKKEGLR